MSARWLVAILLVGLATTRAHADGSDKAAAEALFDEGRKLMAEGHFDEACPKLEASQRLDQGVGTQLNLADCYEKSGKTASAWAEFRAASAAAHKAGSKQREDIARKRAAALEGRLSYLTIDVGGQTGLEVTRNDITVDPALLGSPIPVDPGQQAIAVKAAGKQPWTSTLRIAADGDRVNVRVPVLEDEVVTARAEAPPPSAAGTAPKAAEATQPVAPPAAVARGADPGSTQRILGWVSAGIGVAGIAIGTGFGIDAMQRKKSADAQCIQPASGPRMCWADGIKDNEAAGKSADIATIGFIVGAAGAAGAIVLWLTAPSAEAETQTAFELRPGGMALQGTF